VNYVVLGAQEVEVRLLDQRTVQAETIGLDFASGLALLRIRAGGLRALPLRDTREVARGDQAFMVASIVDEEGKVAARVSDGVVSYIGPFDANWEYVLERALMTTAMNPGLGGGPLIDTSGRGLGVVSLNLSEIGRFSLVIPADHYLEARARRLAGQPAPSAMRAWLGIFCYGLRDHVVIAGLLPGGPGERAGLKTGDVILAVDGQEVADRRSLYRLVWTHRAGETVTLRIARGREQRTVTVAAGDAEEFFA
jgi:S1-C subfamily serine protease